MSIISGFPRTLLEEHRRWHNARHTVDTDRPPDGYGEDFLLFHRSFIRKALRWYERAGHDLNLVEPWSSVPEPIRQASCYDRRAEYRVLLQPETFASSDELGRFIEGSGLHGCIHQEAAELFEEPELNDFDIAPRSTYFYNIHGMIDRWWRNWEGLGNFNAGLSFWRGKFYEREGEVLRYRREDGSWWLGRPEVRSRREKFGPVREAAGDNAAGENIRLDWGAVGESRTFGAVNDGRPFRVWDTDGDGRLDVLFQSPLTGDWWEGSLRSGRLVWSPIRLECIGLPSQSDDPLRAISSRKRKTPI
ncbi:hypothetical protein [Cohnella thermotolerans]|uniref:hypothetical protein n=1 Tax=Cohnella thermotolerans TaxID=329858 RepID=UPI0006876D75|nr:hypothetical protein [Cohnella thermotolerans]